MHRRAFLEFAGLAAAGLLLPAPLRAALTVPDEKALTLRNAHTGERERLVFWADGAHVPEALTAANRLLRDHRTGEVHRMDPALLDQLHAVAGACGVLADFEVLSGYRSAATNEALRRAGRGVAKRSFHLTGQAADVRLAGVDLRDLRRAARALRRGGVGHYPGPGFVHLDTGPVRTW